MYVHAAWGGFFTTRSVPRLRGLPRVAIIQGHQVLQLSVVVTIQANQLHTAF